MADKAILTVRPQITVPIDEARVKSGKSDDLLKVIQDITRAVQDQYRELAQVINLHAKYPNQDVSDRLDALEAVPVLHSVGGSRALDTVYHNTTGRNMIVMVALYSAIGQRVFYAKVGTSSPPSIQVGILQPPLNATVSSFSFLVPSGSYYAIMRGSDSGTIYSWVEAY